MCLYRSKRNKKLSHIIQVSTTFMLFHVDQFPDGHPNSPTYGHLKLPHLN
jgi:hypothetical protein